MELESGLLDVEVEEAMECINSHKKFKARPGSPFRKGDAQLIGETLDNIRIENGGSLKPDVIVAIAKKRTNPLHNLFEWDDTICGEQYRLQQARNITNHIVEVIIVNKEPIEQRSFFSVVNSEQETVYVSRAEAITNVDYKKQLLNQMISTMENLLITIKLFKEEHK